MATYEQRDQSGTLFKNQKKTEAKHPDYQGDCMVNGVKMRMSAWLKESNGKKFMSLAFSAPYIPEMSQDEKQRSKVDASMPPDDFEENIPF